jgi:endonuclease/exonuclease/phosphatase family metal-dependent hydrolase
MANNNLPFVAMVLVGAAVLIAMRRMPNLDAASSWTSATIAFALFLVPVFLALNFSTSVTIPGKGFPVRVMSYNLHNGFNTDGRLDPEALARTIQSANPDIVGLQEVERGWMIDSNLDLLTYLSQKLQMPYIFAPTADPVWGNAILSRYPITDWGNVPLPPRTLLLKRGFLWARVDVGNGDELFLIATHFHHINKDTEIRQQQSPEIVKFWSQRPRTIFLGDLNAQPDSKEIAILRDSGLVDSFAAIGTGDGLTFYSAKPSERIDYLWLSPDLALKDFFIPQSTASDHLGIAVTVSVK